MEQTSVTSRILSMTARLIREGLVKKAQDRYNEGQIEREVLDVFYTAMKVGDCVGSVVKAEDTDEMYNISEYKFPRNLVTLATFSRVYFNSRNRDAGLELFRYNVSSDVWKLRVTMKGGDWKEEVEDFKPKFLSPARLEMIYTNWTSGLSKEARFQLGSPEVYKKEARYVSELNVVVDSNDGLSYVSMEAEAKKEDVALGVILGYSLPFRYLPEFAHDTASITDLALWIFGGPSSLEGGNRDAKDRSEG